MGKTLSWEDLSGKVTSESCKHLGQEHCKQQIKQHLQRPWGRTPPGMLLKEGKREELKGNQGMI